MPVFFTHDQPVLLTKRQTTYYSHYHYEAELVYVVKGSYRVISKGVTYDLHDGDIWLGFPFDEHSYVDTGDNYTLIGIFAPEHIGSVGRLLCTRQPGRTVVNVSELSPGFGEELVRVAQMWMATAVEDAGLRWKYYRDTDPDERYKGLEITREAVLAYLTASMTELLGAMKLSPNESPCVYSIQKVMNYCVANISDPGLSMSKLTEAVGLSRSQISRLMSSMMKTSFPEFLHSLRIKQARSLVGYTDKSIIDIAYECGFTSSRNFNRVFHSVVGMSPSEFRELRKKLGSESTI